MYMDVWKYVEEIRRLRKFNFNGLLHFPPRPRPPEDIRISIKVRSRIPGNSGPDQEIQQMLMKIIDLLKKDKKLKNPGPGSRNALFCFLKITDCSQNLRNS